MSYKIDLRRSILDTTRHLLIQDGIAQLSMRKVARAVGCSVGSIYVYFANKDELVHALIEEGFDMELALQQQVAEQHHNPRERLEALCRLYVQFAFENPEYYEIMYMLDPERMARYPAEKYRKARRGLELIADTIAECAAQGLLEVEEPFIEATFIWTQLHGMVSLFKADRIDHRIDREQFIDYAIRRLLGEKTLLSAPSRTDDGKTSNP